MEETEIIMDYEKKDFRKLYEDLVKSEWFKKAYHDKSLGDCPFNIPELAESEDERMCTRCIELLRKVSAYSGEEYLGVEIADCIIWLQALRKKQKESLHIPQTCKENPDSFTDEDEKVRKEILAFVIDMDCKESWIHYLEKQKEHQNNSDAPKEKSVGGDFLSSHKDKNLDEIAQDYVDDVKQYHQEPTWDLMQTAVCYGANWQKEQFEKNRLANCNALSKEDCDRETDFAMEIIEKEHRQPTFNDAINYGMRLQKEQKPADRFEEAREKYQVEWSEEETIDLVHILKVLDDCYIYGKHDLCKTDYDNLTSTLKSLRPSWKPSEEQMEQLQRAINCYESDWGENKVLRSVINELKKQM